MKKGFILAPFIISLAVVVSGFVLYSKYSEPIKKLTVGAPTSARYERELTPVEDSKYYLGTSSPILKAWRGLIVDEICLAGDCQTTWSAGSGDITNGSSLGTGLNIFDSKSGSTLRFNSISAGANVSISTSSDSNTLVISSTGGSGGADFPNVQAWGNSTSTTLGFLNGFLSTASSTIVGQTNLMGNVGIGTTTPWAQLSVHRNTSDTSYSPLFAVASSTASATTTAFVVANNGYTGIGIAAPAYKLDVDGDIRYGANGTLRISGAGNFKLDSDELFFGGGSSGTIKTNWGGGSLSLIAGGNNQTSGDISLITNTASGDVTRLIIKSDGNVGVGSTTPWGKLSVTNTGTGPSFIVEDSASPDSSPFVIDASGNVGVGTANPNSLLQIYGQGADILTVGNGVDTSTSFNVQNRALFGYNQTRAAATVQGIAGRGIDFNVNSSTFGSGQAMVITSAGNVGIGTTSPQNKLHLNTSSASQYIQLTTDTTGSLSSDGFQIGVLNSGADASLWNLENGYMRFATNNQERMRIDASGNVGIGTTTPTQLLTLSTGYPVLKFEETGVTANNKLWYFEANGEVFKGRILNDSETIGSDWLQIDRTGATVDSVSFPNGNIGIGTTSPSKLLTVGNNNQFTVNSSGDITTGKIGLSTDTSKIEFLNNQLAFSASSNFLRFNTTGFGINAIPLNGLDVNGNAVIGSSYAGVNSAPSNGLLVQGNVGISTTTPAARLSVNSVAGDAFSLWVGSTTAPWLRTSNSGFGTTTLSGLTVAGSATSTSNVGFNISAGCYAIGGNCISGGSSSGAAYDWQKETNFAALSLTPTTTIPVWFKGQIQASSSLQFNTNLISEHASLRFLDIQGRAGGDYTLARIKAPLTTPYEATLALLLDESGDNSGINESFFDLYNEGYADSYQAGFRLINNGTARMKPIVLGHYNDDGLSKDNGNKLVLFPSGTVWMGQGTSTANLSTQLHIASTTATNLLRIDGSSTNRLVVAQTGTTVNGGLDLSGATVKQSTYSSFSYATTTWTGTTTIPLGPAYTAESWAGVKCFTDTGTVNVSFYDGTNRMNMLNASTTVGSFSLATNNTFTASEKRYVDIGTPASSPTKISCTVDKIVNN